VFYLIRVVHKFDSTSFIKRLMILLDLCVFCASFAQRYWTPTHAVKARALLLSNDVCK